MILLINTCVSSLHTKEFVDPVIRCINTDYKVVHYTKLTPMMIEAARGIIICGTALIDNNFLGDLELFLWIRECKKPLLGICAGMEIIAQVHGAQLEEKKEIGLTTIDWQGEKKEVYTLHQLAPTCPEGFTILARNDMCIHAIQKGTIQAVLFHPEVRNQELITSFIHLCNQQ